MLKFFKRKFTNRAEKKVEEPQWESAYVEMIIGDFGALMEKGIDPITYYDVSMLPHAKEDILKALLISIKFSSDPTLREHFKVALVFLAQFQEGVGPNPISPLPVDLAALMEAKDAGKISIQEVILKVAEASSTVDQSKLSALKEKVTQESFGFLEMARAVRD
ncbi:MAG: hypothetical protein IH878_16090 [Gemmatimonadetes bacterium]|nr:hypothetical protein [Gemmatimonadota bacterium]